MDAKHDQRPARRRPDLQLRLSSIIATQLDLLAPGANLDALLRMVAGKAQRLTGASGATVSLLDGSDLVFRAVCGNVSMPTGTRFHTEGSLAGQSMHDRTVLRCDDAEQDPRVDKGLCQQLGARSVLATPLWHGDTVAGVLEVYSPETSDFTDEDARTLQLMSGLIGTAITRAQEDESQRRLLEERERATQLREQLIRQREQALRELERSQATLRVFFDAAPLGMCTLERTKESFAFLSVNSALASRFGMDATKLIGRQLRDLETGVEPELHVRLTDCVTQGTTVTWESLSGSGRQAKSTLLTASPQPGGDADSARVCLIAQDITEQARLRQRADLAERLASLGRLAAGVAHEANNPLAYVISNLSFAMEELKSLQMPEDPRSTEVMQALIEAHEGAERVRVVVRDLHTFASADTERRTYIDVATAVKRCVAMAKHEIVERGKVHVDYGQTPNVLGNEARLGQVILNLLVNAAHAMAPETKQTNEIRVKTGVMEDGRVYVDVKDTGHGIPADLLPRIFDPFFTTKPLGQGMGLGLSISHSIVAAHGGELSVVESAPGKGTTFRVALPAVGADD